MGEERGGKAERGVARRGSEWSEWRSAKERAATTSAWLVREACALEELAVAVRGGGAAAGRSGAVGGWGGKADGGRVRWREWPATAVSLTYVG